MNHGERLKNILVERSLRLGEFTLASGARSTYYVDARLTTLTAEGQFLLGRLGLTALLARGWCPSHVGGLTMGADPIAYAIAHASWESDGPIDAFTVRKEAKDHGAGRRVEGGVDSDSSCVVVEDSITSGGSAIRAVNAVREIGARVLGVLALVDRQEGGREALASEGVELHALYEASELLAAKKAGA